MSDSSEEEEWDDEPAQEQLPKPSPESAASESKSPQ